jgi:pimeloyl-ACP methyl ester carboxylesterase
MSLAHVRYAAEGATPRRSAWFIHGIMGSQRNWRSFARGLAERHPEWSCVTLDLRNHGASGSRPDPQTLEACADDLQELAREIGTPDLVSGHSFGGKVALAWAARRAEQPRRFWILDCPPGLGRTDSSSEVGGELARVLEAVDAIPTPLARRGEVLGMLVARGLSRPLASWMSTNLVRSEAGGYVWAFDLDGIRAMIADYWARDFFPFLETRVAAQVGAEFDFVRAANSDRWTEEDQARLASLAASPALRYRILEEAGHWLHVDNPEGLSALFDEALAAD